MIIIGGRGKMDIGLTSRRRKDNVKNMKEKEQLEKLISEYDNVATHYNEFSIASRGIRRPGEQRTHAHSKAYSNTQEFIAWTSRIRMFLRSSSVSETEEAGEIHEYINTFKGFAEEKKLKTLLAMLKALHENWDILSNEKDGGKGRRMEVSITPKFEFKCIDGEGESKTFSLKNVSSAYVSEIRVEAFELLSVDGSKQNLFLSDINMPTSLGPGQSEEFTYNHRYFEQRGGGFKEYRLEFSATDDYSDKFRCVATKNVEYERGYMVGDWYVDVSCIEQESLMRERGSSNSMQKKYQVFISSTYTDLIEPRAKVRDAIMSMNHFPVGMEFFGAANEAQWKIIQETIDCTDYYVLIIGQRYGTVIEDGPDAGISYTEKEFKYALEKGVPILAFIMDESIPVKPENVEIEHREELAAFRQTVKTGRLVEWWKTSDELAQKVTAALHNQMLRTERPGWIRGKMT